jgi:hypothetical protein
MHDPIGAAHGVDLDAWSGRDPDRTRLLIGLGHQQRSTPIGMTGTRYDMRWHRRAMDAV